MASPFGHFIAGATIAGMSRRGTGKPLKYWFWCLVSSVIPDVDVITFKLGIPYESPWGHRGFSHSILFAIMWALLIGFIFFRRNPSRLKIVFVLFLVTISHGALDAMTNGGLGIGFYIPFEMYRIFFPWRPIEVSPISVVRFWNQAKFIMLNEALWIGLPCLGVYAIQLLVTKDQKKNIS